jgi:hypothetical protein
VRQRTLPLSFPRRATALWFSSCVSLDRKAGLVRSTRIGTIPFWVVLWLTAIPFELRAATAELSTTIVRVVSQKTPVVTIHAGEPVTFEVKAVNSGSVGADAVLLMVFPEGFTDLTASGLGLTCSPVARTVSCNTTSSLLMNFPRSIRLTAKAPLTITGDSQSFTITARIDPKNLVAEANEEDNQDTVVTTVVPRGPDLKISLAGSDATATAAEDARYTVRLSNVGDRATSSDALVVATLPSDILFARVDDSQFTGCHGPGPNIYCNPVGPIAAGASKSATIVGHVSSQVAHHAVVTVTAKVNPGIGDFDETNNAATFNTTLTEGANLVVANRTVSSHLRCDLDGNPLTPETRYDLISANVKNSGHVNAAATKVRVNLSGPNSVFAIGCGSHKQTVRCDGSCVPSACTATGFHEVTCDIGPLAPGGVQQIGLTAGAGASDSYTVEFEADAERTVVESNESNVFDLAVNP